MNVVCIGVPKYWDSAEVGSEKPKVKEGEVYTVNDENDDMYELTCHLGFSYSKHLFVPISDIDEREFIRNYQKELA